MSKRCGILICTIACLFCAVKCEAQSQFSPVLTKMENSLFGMDYNNQSDDARLKRIENAVYGSSSSTSVSQRMDKLKKDLSVDVIDQKIKPTRDTFAEEQDSLAEKIPKADSNINYPIVNELEKTVFGKDFKAIDVTQRLANLEQNVFKKTYNDDLNSRVDRLKSAVMPNKSFAADSNNDCGDSDYYAPQSDLASQNQQYSDDYSDLADNFGTPQYNKRNSVLDDVQSDSDIAIPLSALEKRVLRKSFPDDTVSNRLTRLELRVFNSTFPDDDEQARLGRIASAYQAKKTSKKYDGNKFAQHTAAAMQVGAILLMILAAIL